MLTESVHVVNEAPAELASIPEQQKMGTFLEPADPPVTQGVESKSFVVPVTALTAQHSSWKWLKPFYNDKCMHETCPFCLVLIKIEIIKIINWLRRAFFRPMSFGIYLFIFITYRYMYVIQRSTCSCQK